MTPPTRCTRPPRPPRGWPSSPRRCRATTPSTRSTSARTRWTETGPDDTAAGTWAPRWITCNGTARTRRPATSWSPSRRATPTSRARSPTPSRATTPSHDHDDEHRPPPTTTTEGRRRGRRHRDVRRGPGHDRGGRAPPGGDRRRPGPRRCRAAAASTGPVAARCPVPVDRRDDRRRSDPATDRGPEGPGPSARAAAGRPGPRPWPAGRWLLVAAGLVVAVRRPTSSGGRRSATGRASADLRARFDREAGRPARPATGPRAAAMPVPGAGDPVGVLVIPKLGLDQVVVEGVGAAQLAVGPGHYPGTAAARPGRQRRHRRAPHHPRRARSTAWTGSSRATRRGHHPAGHGSPTGWPGPWWWRPTDACGPRPVGHAAS